MGFKSHQDCQPDRGKSSDYTRQEANQMSKKLSNKNVRLIVIAFFIFLGIGVAFVYFIEQRRISSYKRSVTIVTAIEAFSIHQQLDHSLSATFALASILRQYGVMTNFDDLAAEIIEHYGGISNLQLAPNAVVRQIFPLKGNEAAIGHDLLNDPNRRTEALSTIESKKLTLAGPFELIQGGVGVIGRYPVFLPDELTSENVFWGFTIVLIKLADLIRASDLNQLIENGYNYNLSRIHPVSHEREIFVRSNQQILNDPVEIDISVPNGSWTLSVEPQNGWIDLTDILIEVIIFAIIIAGATLSLRQRLWFVQELSKKNVLLSDEIDVRIQAELETSRLVTELQKALSEVKTLGGLLPICASCKKIRDDNGYWTQVEEYVKDRTNAEFSHGICPSCVKKLYSNI